MKTGDKVDKYTLLCDCGKGAFGQVFLAERNDGKHVAFKVVSLVGESGERELQAIESYRKCPQCEALLEIYDLVIPEDHEKFYYTMELADNLLGEESTEYVPATLAEVLRRDEKLNVPQTIELIVQLLEGLAIIHSNKLVHRDIKPANIIWVNGRAKFSDIGLMSNDLSLTYRAGSDGFLPPKESCIPQNSTTVDLYALTRVIYCCLSGKPVNEYPDIGWIDTDDERVGKLQDLMLKTDEELVKMDVSDFQLQLLEATLKAARAGDTVACFAKAHLPVGALVGGAIAGMLTSKDKAESALPNDSLSSLPSLSKITSAESWIRRQKQTNKDFLKAAAIVGATTAFRAPMGLVATVGTLALLAGGAFLLGKIGRN